MSVKLCLQASVQWQLPVEIKLNPGTPVRKTNTKQFVLYLNMAFVFCASTVNAQDEGKEILIFDDFSYSSYEQMTGKNLWTDLSGKPFTREAAWFTRDWEIVEQAPTAHFKFDKPGRVRLETEAGHSYQWTSGALPPFLTSGFTSRTGTWVSRVRLDDIRSGIVTNSPVVIAFWTYSANSICRKQPGDNACRIENRFWSEFDHEWNNSFNQKYPQFISNGVAVDGVLERTRSFIMGSPAKRSTEELSCLHVAGSVQTRIDNPTECMRWFVSDEDDDRFVDLLIQYDDEVLVFEAIAWKVSQPTQLEEKVIMRTTIRLDKKAQPMVSRFSLLGRTFNQCRKSRITNRSCWIQEKNIGFSIDWFYFTPDTDIDLKGVLDTVDRLRSRGLSRVNTTGKSLAGPPVAQSITATLENPLTNRAKEWVLTPALRSTKYNLFIVRWRYRTRLSSHSLWSEWTIEDHKGFTFSPPIRYSDFESVEVRAELTDWYVAQNRGEVGKCLVDYGRREGPCATPIVSPGTASVFPNPFRQNTSLVFMNESAGAVRVAIFDILGREVIRPVDEYRDAGSVVVSVESGDLPAGVYFYTVVTASGKFSGKMVRAE